MVRLFNFIVLILFSASVYAANITVETDRDPVAMDETFRIIFTVEGSQDSGPNFSPLNKDFQLLGTSQSSSFTLINGKMSRSKTYTLSVAAKRKGKLTIPSIRFGKDKSPTRRITVNDTGRSASGARPNSNSSPGDSNASSKEFFVTTEVDDKNPYVQQQVVLKLKLYQRVAFAGLDSPEFGFTGAAPAIQPLGKQKTYQSKYKGVPYQVTELRYALFPQQSGELVIKPYRITAKIAAAKQKKRSSFGSIFGDPSNDPFLDDFFSRTRRSYINKTAFSKAIKLEVKPIPKAFTGKQWLPAKSIQLKQTWSADINQLKAGEPVTRTVALIADGLGAGQLPAIHFEDKDGLKHYPDQAVSKEKASNRGLLSTKTQKVALIPSKGGEFKIPAIEIPWWNTKTNKMEIATIAAQTLTATGSALSAPASAATDLDTNMNSPQTPPTTMPIAIDQTNQQKIPYEWLLLAVGVLLLLWLATLLAWLRSKKSAVIEKTASGKEATNASRRQALKQLDKACQSKQAEAVREALIQWGKTIWPTQAPNSLEEIASRVSPTLATELTQLSRALYSPDQADWNADAILQLAKKFNVAALDSNNDKGSDLEPLYR